MNVLKAIFSHLRQIATLQVAQIFGGGLYEVFSIDDVFF